MELNEDIDKGLSLFKTDEGQIETTSLELQSHVQSTANTTPDMIGPSNSKPKGTWTRINRMDFGLRGLTRAITLPGLGKRDQREVQEWQNEEQAIKRGKVSSDEGSNDHISVGWRATLARSNETIKLELSRAWESFDRSKPSQDCEGAGFHGLFFYGDKTK